MAKKSSSKKSAPKRPAGKPAPRAAKPASKPKAKAKPGKPVKPAKAAKASKPAKSKGSAIARGIKVVTPVKKAARRAAPEPRVHKGPAAKAVSTSASLAKKAKAQAEKMEQARAFAIEAARSLSDDKCENVRLLDVRGIYKECDYVVIASGSSDRQMRSAGDSVERVGASMGYPLVRHEADDRTTWLLLDFVDVTVHLFEPETRLYYDLEMRWGDAKTVKWERAGAPARA